MGSCRNYTLELSFEAYDDLVDIQNYTYAEFGESQWRKYEALLNKAFGHILDNPYSGHKRDDLPNEYLAHNVGGHVIVFRIEHLVIYVVRVLHRRMNFPYQVE